MRFLSLVFGIVLLLAACQNTKTVDSSSGLQVSAINPNGDSELALLMREMFDHSMKMKKALKSGEKVVVERDFAEMLNAQATEPEKAASNEFQAFGRAYVNILQQMEEAPTEDIQGLYDNMVANCMACHTALCPGPKMRIKHLIMEESK